MRMFKLELTSGKQSQGRADSHLTRLPGGPRGLAHREALEVTLGLSLGLANHRPLRGQFPTARAQVWREVPKDLARPLGRSRKQSSVPGLKAVQGPKTIR